MVDESSDVAIVAAQDGPLPTFKRIADFYVAPSSRNVGREVIQLLFEYSDGSIRGQFWHVDLLAADLAKSPNSIVSRAWAQECKADPQLVRSASDLNEAYLRDFMGRYTDAVLDRIKRGEKMLGKAIGNARKELQDALARLDVLEAQAGDQK